MLLVSPKKAYATKRLQEEAAALGIGLASTEIGELRRRNFQVDPADFDALYLRQAYTEFRQVVPESELEEIIGFAKKFKDAGKVVVDDSIASGDLGQGKYEALVRLQQEGAMVPKTVLLKDVPSEKISYPIIAKWNYGFGAKHAYLLKTADDLAKVAKKYSPDQILLQEFIPAGCEYKIITVGYRSLPVIIKVKTARGKFLPDLDNYEILSAAAAPEAVKLAETGAKVLKRELAKADILEANGRLYLLEVNRWPGLQYFEKAAKFNVAAEFLRYLSEACKKAGFPL